MAKNKLADLRDHLFETLEALRDADNPMELDRARAIGEIAQTLINAAKVEVDLVKAVGGSGAGTFFALKEESRELPKIGESAKSAPSRPLRIAERAATKGSV